MAKRGSNSFHNIGEIRQRNKRAGRYVEKRLKEEGKKFTPKRGEFLYEEYLLKERIRRAERAGKDVEKFTPTPIPKHIGSRDIEKVRNQRGNRINPNKEQPKTKTRHRKTPKDNPNRHDIPEDDYDYSDYDEPEDEDDYTEALAAYQYFDSLKAYLEMERATIENNTPPYQVPMTDAIDEMIDFLRNLLSQDIEDILNHYKSQEDALNGIESMIDKWITIYNGFYDANIASQIREALGMFDGPMALEFGDDYY